MVTAYLNIKIHGLVDVTLSDRTLGSQVLVSEADAARLKAAGLLDWMDTDGKAALPAKWSKGGEPLHTWLGIEPREPVKVEAAEAEFAIEGGEKAQP